MPWLGPDTSTGAQRVAVGVAVVAQHPGGIHRQGRVLGRAVGIGGRGRGLVGDAWCSTAPPRCWWWGGRLARSGLPSALKSATATEAGRVPVGKLVGAAEAATGAAEQHPDAGPRLRWATARSGSPSRLKSPTATEDSPACWSGQEGGRAGEAAAGAAQQHQNLAGTLRRRPGRGRRPVEVAHRHRDGVGAGGNRGRARRRWPPELPSSTEHPTGVVVGDRQVGIAVAVELAHRHRRRCRCRWRRWSDR